MKSCKEHKYWCVVRTLDDVTLTMRKQVPLHLNIKVHWNYGWITILEGNTWYKTCQYIQSTLRPIYDLIEASHEILVVSLDRRPYYTGIIIVQ